MTEKAQHTPGPWRASDNGGYAKIFGNAEDDIVGVATVYNTSDDPERPNSSDEDCRRWHAEQAANARLIAAAPELLEELKNLVAICARAAPDHDLAISRARAAIAKAEGRS